MITLTPTFKIVTQFYLDNFFSCILLCNWVVASHCKCIEDLTCTDKYFVIIIIIIIGIWAGRATAPQSHKFLTFFGQNFDDSGKGTREKTFFKGSQGQSCSLISLTFALPKRSQGQFDISIQVFCFWKAMYVLQNQSRRTSRHTPDVQRAARSIARSRSSFNQGRPLQRTLQAFCECRSHVNKISS